MPTGRRRAAVWWRYPLLYAITSTLAYTLLPPQRSVVNGVVLGVLVPAVGLPLSYLRMRRRMKAEAAIEAPPAGTGPGTGRRSPTSRPPH